MNIRVYLPLVVGAMVLSCGTERGRESSADLYAAERLDVELVTDEADAVLTILDTRAAGEAPDTADWRRLFATEGYRRLQQRERSLQRSFDDTTFRAFAMSDSLLARAPALRNTLDAWRTVEPVAAARRAFAYLPSTAVVRARIYPVIKPQSNSFVFEPRTNPAIFLYIDPTMSSAQFENTLAHELHHIGVASACDGVPRDTTLAPGVQAALDWMGAFAEGRAMLAAAGSADAHPHAVSDSADRAVWERDIARVGEDVRRLEAFFMDLIHETMTDETATRHAFTFFSTDSVPQGAFYTVGYLMSATIERVLGRERLVASTCDPRMFMTDYRQSALQLNQNGEALPLWSDSLLYRIGATEHE